MFKTFFAVSPETLWQSDFPHSRSKFTCFFRSLRCCRSLYRAINRLQFWLGFIFLDSLILASSAVGQAPATVGQFSSVTNWPFVAAHAHVLPTGKVIWSPQF